VGRTPRGFGRRLGSDYASEIIQNSVHDSMAAVAGTDTRYFACDCTGLFPRTGHALKMTLLTYTSSGHLTVDIPQLSGAYGSSMIEKMCTRPTTARWSRECSPATSRLDPRRGAQSCRSFLGAEAHLPSAFPDAFPQRPEDLSA